MEFHYGFESVGVLGVHGISGVREFHPHYFAVFGDPDLVDKAVFDRVVRILYSDPDNPVTEGEHYSVERSAVAVVDVNHLTHDATLTSHSIDTVVPAVY